MVYDERKSRPEVKVEPEAHWGSRTGAEFTLCVETAYAANTQGKVNLCSRSNLRPLCPAQIFCDPVIRGPLFSAIEVNPAKQIWLEARKDLMVSLLLDGSVLNFSSNKSPNISD